MNSLERAVNAGTGLGARFGGFSILREGIKFKGDARKTRNLLVSDVLSTRRLTAEHSSEAASGERKASVQTEGARG